MKPGELARARMMQFEASFLYEPADQIYVDSHRAGDLEESMGLRTLRGTLLLKAEISLGERFIAEAQLPLVSERNDAKATSGRPPPTTVQATGLGDGALLLHVRLAKPAASLPEGVTEAAKPELMPLSLHVGIRLPTGDSEVRDSLDKRADEETLQLGAGVPAAIAGANGYWQAARDVTVHAALTARIHFLENRHGYRYGSGFQGNLGAEWTVARQFTTGLLATCLWSLSDRKDGDIAGSTGRRDLIVGPSVSYSSTPDFTARLSLLFPVLTRTTGFQLSTPVVLGVTATYRQ